MKTTSRAPESELGQPFFTKFCLFSPLADVHCDTNNLTPWRTGFAENEEILYCIPGKSMAVELKGAKFKSVQTIAGV